MSEEFQKHMFEEFSREVSATTKKQEGTGLGLSIANRITILMGGRIDVQSALGQGSTFTMIVPLRTMTVSEAADYRRENGQEEELTDAERVDTILKGKKVLLVEDNELNREIAHDILEEQEMDVTDAEDGAIAVEIVRKMCERGIPEEYFDFILMDIQMPVMNVFKAAVAIRELPDPLNTHIPIIAMTANAFDEDRQKSRECGMDAHLAKPINVQLLKETLASFL